MIQLSDHFTYKKLLRYTLPSIVMLIVTSIYGVIDGLFVSNFVGKTAFAAVNFILPFLMILGGFGLMFGTGGGALIAKTVGEGEKEEANRIFSSNVYISIAFGILLLILGNILLRPVAVLLGAEGQLLEDSIIYGRVYLLGVPACMLQYQFQCLFATAEKPNLGLYVTAAAGITNIVLDALFVAVLPGGLIGAAAATVISQCVGGIVPLIYFGRKNSSLLRLVKTSLNINALKKTCFNGSSELLNNISISIVGMLYNVQLLKYAGEDGVAAYGVMMYVSLIFTGLFIGYAIGVSPIISYHYGAQNLDELKSLLRKSFMIILCFAVMMFGAALLLAKPLSIIFVGYDATLMQMTLHGFFIFSFSFLFAGFAILGSSFFTALNDGLVSAIISFLRTLVFQIAAVLIFPYIWELDGIWISTVIAEAMATIVALFFIIGNRKKYQY